jgi:hypothetical protein
MAYGLVAPLLRYVSMKQEGRISQINRNSAIKGVCQDVEISAGTSGVKVSLVPKQETP